MPMAWRSGKLKRHLMLRQNWIAWSLKRGLRPRLPLGWPCQFIEGSSQMSSEPRDFNASLYIFQFVVRYFCGAGFIRSGYPTFDFYAGRAWFMQQSPPDAQQWADGDTLLFSSAPGGLRITRDESDVRRQLALAMEIMAADFKLLRELAKR